MIYIIAIIVFLVTYFFAFLWWLSGVQGGASTEPAPWMAASIVTAIAIGIMLLI